MDVDCNARLRGPYPTDRVRVIIGDPSLREL